MSQYTVYVTPSAWEEIKNLPGNMRQRVRRTIEALGDRPRPSQSTQLDVAKIEVPGLSIEPRRIRIEQWRIVYTITETEGYVDIVAVRKRPPYDYEDIEQLLADIL